MITDAEMLEFLMENDVMLKSMSTKRMMTADEAFILGGEFIVFADGNVHDLYRGIDLKKAMEVLERKSE